jgi:hypothetical protein
MKKLFAGILALSALTFGAPAIAWDGYRGHDYDRGHGYSYGGYSHGGHYGSRSSFGFYVGLPLFWPRVDYYRPYYSYPYPYPYSYPSTQVMVERQPPVYVQRETPVAAAPAASGFWYYCPDSQTYYPYAQTCPSPWLQVVPQTNANPQVPR